MSKMTIRLMISFGCRGVRTYAVYDYIKFYEDLNCIFKAFSNFSAYMVVLPKFDIQDSPKISFRTFLFYKDPGKVSFSKVMLQLSFFKLDCSLWKTTRFDSAVTEELIRGEQGHRTENCVLSALTINIKGCIIVGYHYVIRHFSGVMFLSSLV